MDQVLAIAGQYGLPGIVVLLIILGKVHTQSAMTAKDNEISNITIAHDKVVTDLTAAHNLRVEQMTEAHNRATDERRADHKQQLTDVVASYTAQLQNLTEVYGKQVSWTADDRNGWHEAYSDISTELPVIAHALNKLTAAHESLVDQLIGRDIAGQRVEDDGSH